MTKKKFDYEQFAIDWQRLNSVADVAEKHGINEQSASQLAYRLRKKGVPLKNMNIIRIDIDQITAALAG